MNATPAPHKKVLIVDDNQDVRLLLRLTLDENRYTIFEAHDGDEALRMIEASPPDILLLDIMMPGEHDGLEVCRLIKTDERLRHIVVIIISARAQVADIEKGKKAGADFYLTKPFSPLELIGLIESNT